MLKKLLHLQIKYHKQLLIFLLFIILIAGYFAVQLQIDPSFSVLVSDTSEFNTNNRILTNAFGVNDAVLILLRLDPSSTLDNVPTTLEGDAVDAYIASLEETLLQSTYVVSISEPQFSPDMRNAQITVLLSVPEKTGAFRGVLDELNSLVASVGTPVGIEAVVTGLPVLLNRVSTLLIQDNLTTILITIAFVLAILYWYSRDPYFTFVTLMSPLLSLVFLAAAMVILDIDVTITLAAVGVLVLGLGVDYSIHIATHYRRARDHHESHEKALLHTIDDLKIPITASFVTTLAGFSALIFGVSPSSQAQGTVLSLSIAIIYGVTFVCFPLLITFFSSKIRVVPNKTFDKIMSYITRLAIYQTHHAKTVVAIIAALTVVMFIGMTQVSFSTSNSNWIPDGDPVSLSFREITYTYGDIDTISIVVIATEGDLRNVQTARDLNHITNLIEGVPYVDFVSSPYKDLPYDSGKLHDAITYGNLRSNFNHDYTITRLVITSQNLDEDEAGESMVLEEVRSILAMYPVHNADISLYGDVVRFSELGESLQRDAGVTTMMGLSLVFFVASAIYASLIVGALALIPIIIAVIWAVGLMGFFGVPFTSLSTGIISLVLGVGVDFSIHLVDSITKAQKRMDLESAVAYSLSHSGSAIFLSSVTTFVGFLALTFATLLGTQRLGWSLAFSILSVFIVSVTLVPALLALVHFRKSKQLKRK